MSSTIGFCKDRCTPQQRERYTELIAAFQKSPPHDLPGAIGFFANLFDDALLDSILAGIFQGTHSLLDYLLDPAPIFDSIFTLLSDFVSYECLSPSLKILLVLRPDPRELATILRDLAHARPTRRIGEFIPEPPSVLRFTQEEVKNGILRAQTEFLSDVGVSDLCKALFERLTYDLGSTILLGDMVDLLSDGRAVALEIMSRIRTEVPLEVLLDLIVIRYLNFLGYDVTPEMRARIVHAAGRVFADPVPIANAAEAAVRCEQRLDGRDDKSRRVAKIYL